MQTNVPAYKFVWLNFDYYLLARVTATSSEPFDLLIMDEPNFKVYQKATQDIVLRDAPQEEINNVGLTTIYRKTQTKEHKGIVDLNIKNGYFVFGNPNSNNLIIEWNVEAI